MYGDHQPILAISRAPLHSLHDDPIPTDPSHPTNTNASVSYSRLRYAAANASSLADLGLAGWSRK